MERKKEEKTNLEQRKELRILDSHVLDRIQESDSFREPLLDLSDSLRDGLTSLERSKILGHEDPDVGERGEGGEEDGDDERLSLLSGRAGKDVGGR